LVLLAGGIISLLLLPGESTETQAVLESTAATRNSGKFDSQNIHKSYLFS